MAVVRTLLVRRAHADGGLAADQGRLVGRGLGGEQGFFDGIGVMAVDGRNDVPAVGLETLRNVFGEPAFDVAVDGDAVVVPEGDQLAQAEGAGQRAGFVRHAFHQAAVAEENESVVIDDFVTRLVELGGEYLFGQREADRVGDALAERAGGRFDARGVAVFRVARRPGVQLAEVLDVVDRDVVAGQVQQRVDQHRAVAVRQHEAVAVGPFRIGRIVTQMAAPKDFGDFGHAHRGARVSGIRLLDGVHGEGADGASQG